MDFTLRPCEPRDAPAVAELVYLAGKGNSPLSIYDLMYTGPPGPTPVRLAVMERVLISETVSWMHYTHYTVADVDGRVAGALSTFDREVGRTRKLVAALKEAGFDDEALATMTQDMQPVFRVEPDVPDNTWIIENVAVFSEFRRRGIVDALLRDAIARGAQEGFKRMQIGCVIGNEPAERAYRKHGFEVTEVLTDPDFEALFGTPGMKRLTLRL